MPKYCFLLFAWLLWSCSSTSPWQVAHVEAEDPKYSSTSLFSKEEDLQVQLIQTYDTLYIYLESQSLPSLSGRREAFFIEATGESGKKYLLMVLTHKGGQRLVVQNPSLPLFIEALLQEPFLTLNIAGYQKRIDTQGFKEKFRKLKKTTNLKLPIEFSL